MRNSFFATILITSMALIPSSWAQNSGEFYILATPKVLTTKEGEVLQAFLPNGWHTVHKEWHENRGIKEAVPVDQNIITWQEMLAFQVIDKVNLQPEAYLDRLRHTLIQNCEFSHFKNITNENDSRYAEATQISWCGQVDNAPWGEIVLTRVIEGEATLYSLNKSWRTIPFQTVEAINLPEEEIKYWLNNINKNRLCDTRQNDC